MSNIVSFEGHKAQRYIETGLLSFYGDPPDSDHQRGHMCALAEIYIECLNGPINDDRLAKVLGWAGFGPEALPMGDFDEPERGG